jgi:hypothetical protein
MTTKKTTATETSNAAPKKAPRRVHVVAEPKPETVPEREVELDEAPPASGRDAAETDEIDHEAAASASGPTDKKKARRAARLARSKKVRALESAVKRLGELDPEDPELAGLSGAITFLKPILDRVRAAKPKAAASVSTFEAGDEIKLRTKSAPKFAGIIETTDKLVVVATNAKFVTAKLVSGEKVVLSRKDVEAAS